MSDTPRTDAFIKIPGPYEQAPDRHHWIDFARALEREIDVQKQNTMSVRAALLTEYTALARDLEHKLAVAEVDISEAEEAACRAVALGLKFGRLNKVLLEAWSASLDQFREDFRSAADYDDQHGGAWIINDSAWQAACAKADATYNAALKVKPHRQDCSTET